MAESEALAAQYIGQTLAILNLWPAETGRIVIDTSRIIYFWEKEDHTMVRVDCGAATDSLLLEVTETVDDVIKALESAY